MRRKVMLFFLSAGLAAAEVHSLTLEQTLDLASRQSPDVVLARLDQQRAQADVKVATDPFRPKLYGGSGLAYTAGYPNTIDGNAPSLFEAKTVMSLFNRPKSYELAATKELVHGAQYGAQAKTDDVAYRAADLFLTARQAEHDGAMLASEVPTLQKVLEVVNASALEGHQLPLEVKRAKVNLAVSQQRLDALRMDGDYDEMMLAVLLGFSATDRVKPVDSPMEFQFTPRSETDAADAALRNNKELEQIRSNVLAKELYRRSYRANRLPQVDLVAQYSLFARFNYSQYFQKFQSNNGQLGASITIPLLTGSASKGYEAQAEIDMQKLRIQANQVRNRVLVDTRRAYQEWEKAKEIRDLARMQLDLAREDMTVALAQNGEGRLPISQLEQKRLEENDRWMGLYDADTQVTRAKLAILRQMGTLLAVVRAAGVAVPAAHP
jgi:outer membrane protein TolC